MSTQTHTEAHTAAGRPRTGPDTGGDGGTADRKAEAAADVRTRIDELDGRIIALVRERIGVSAGLGPAGAGDSRTAGGVAARAAGTAGGSGGLAREMEVLNRYRGELGRPGTQLAMVLLTLCRGQL